MADAHKPGPETRLVLALKILCGFGTREIARRLLTSDANVHKRLGRGRAILRTRGSDFYTPDDEQLRWRLPSVHRVLYLLFNEGYYLWDATEGELRRRDGQFEAVQAQLERALEQAPTQAEQALIRRRLSQCAQPRSSLTNTSCDANTLVGTIYRARA